MSLCASSGLKPALRTSWLHCTSVIETLRTFPATLRTLIVSAPPDRLRTRPSNGFFALIEHAWHLADLEVEGYEERIRRLLEEDDPYIPDFKGDEIAAQRRSIELELEPA